MAERGRLVKRGTGKAKQKQNVVDVIKRVLRAGEEIKQVQIGYDSTVLTYYANSALFATNNYFALIPPLTQGTGNSDRIGNKVRVKSAQIKMIISPTSYDATVNAVPLPIDLRCIVLHSKNNPTSVVVSSTFFDANDTTMSPQGTLADMLLNVNKDIYVVNKDFRRKLGPASNTGTGSVATYDYMSNNDYKFNQFITLDITKALPKVLEYNDNTSTIAGNIPVMVMLIAPAQGQTVVSTIYQPCKYWYELTLRYTDA